MWTYILLGVNTKKRDVIYEDGELSWWCSGCKKWLPESEFYKKGDRLHARCKPCHIAECMRTRDPDNTRRIKREYAARRYKALKGL